MPHLKDPKVPDVAIMFLEIESRENYGIILNLVVGNTVYISLLESLNMLED